MSRDRDRGEGARVYIGDLGSGGSKPELEREFERYGPLKSVWVARNPPGIFLTYVLVIKALSVLNLNGKLVTSFCELRWFYKMSLITLISLVHWP